MKRDYIIQRPKYMKMEALNHGYLYEILARNAGYGIWNAENKGFVISRFKWSDNYLFEEYHWDSSDVYGTARPIKEIEKSPFEEFDNEGEVLEYLNQFKREE